MAVLLLLSCVKLIKSIVLHLFGPVTPHFYNAAVVAAHYHNSETVVAYLRAGVAVGPHLIWAVMSQRYR